MRALCVVWLSRRGPREQLVFRSQLRYTCDSALVYTSTKVWHIASHRSRMACPGFEETMATSLCPQGMRKASAVAVALHMCIYSIGGAARDGESVCIVVPEFESLANESSRGRGIFQACLPSATCGGHWTGDKPIQQPGCRREELYCSRVAFKWQHASSEHVMRARHAMSEGKWRRMGVLH